MCEKRHERQLAILDEAVLPRAQPVPRIGRAQDRARNAMIVPFDGRSEIWSMQLAER